MNIDKNILMPVRRKYPFPRMEIGDSFDFTEYTAKNALKAGTYCSRRGKALGKVFESRKFIDTKGDLRIRIWRTA